VFVVEMIAMRYRIQKHQLVSVTVIHSTSIYRYFVLIEAAKK